MDQLLALYQALWEAGRPYDMIDFGLGAVDSMRMEKAYRGLGSELTNVVTLLQAGCSRFYRPDKDDFIGRAGAEASRLSGEAKEIIYGTIDATDCDVYGGEPILSGNRVVGVCTSGAYGHAVQKSLAFAYVDANAREDLDIIILGNRERFQILNEPIWDASNSRQRV
ncbi:MAG: aminomethyl transferase family protein [Mesorhizobium sp.]|nr:MAG: aminomethyl transferase family protein [Mesorhizobium sp.]